MHRERPGSIIVVILFIACLLAMPLRFATAGERGPVAVMSVSPEEMVYDTGRDHCDETDTPDEAARAFRDPSGNIHLFVTGSVNREMIGPDFAHLRHLCDIAYKGDLNPNPAAYDDNGWLTAFWAAGNTVFTLIHNEFHGSERPDYCPPRTGPNCIEVAITEGVSTDGGYHFRRFPGDQGLVAALPYRFRPVRPSFFGYSNPSNIIKYNNFFYVLVSAIDPNDRSHNGVCLLRTQTVGNPHSWRGWDGQGFTKVFIDPYKESGSPEANTCTPITKDFFSLGSVAWSPSRKSFLLVTRVQKWDHPKSGAKPGAYIWESEDLIHWTGPTLLFADSQAGGVDQLYPSLIDPTAKDQNFTTIGSKAILFTKITVPGERFYRGWKVVARRVELR